MLTVKVCISFSIHAWTLNAQKAIEKKRQINETMKKTIFVALLKDLTFFCFVFFFSFLFLFEFTAHTLKYFGEHITHTDYYYCYIIICDVLPVLSQTDQFDEHKIFEIVYYCRFNAVVVRNHFIHLKHN